MPTFEEAQDFTLEIRNPEEFTYDWSEWPNQDPPVTDAKEKRQKITEKLVRYNFAICPGELSKDHVARITDDGEPEEIESIAISEGVALVRVHYDGTDDDDDVDTLTGKIVQGKPVCFDMVTGLAITGIPENWAIDEYKIVGTSLVDFSEITDPDSNEKRIPIRLSSISPATGNTQFIVQPQFELRGRVTNEFDEQEVAWQLCPKVKLTQKGDGSVDDYWRWIMEVPDENDTLLCYNPSTRDIARYAYALVEEDGDNSGRYRVIGEYFT